MGDALPQHAIERLKNLRSENSHEGVFTSDLSVNEFLLLQQAGFEPLGLVMGSSVYHIGLQNSKWGQSMEMEVLTQAMYQARELAISRMQSEAEALGAAGVVGVRLTIKRYEWGSDIAEFVAIGTAIESKDRSANFRTLENKPFTSDLSGQDFWTLLSAGYRPLSLVMGTCVYHIAHRGLLASMASVGRNTELTTYTQAFYDARELAMERMQKEAHNNKAEGIVGVQITEGCYGWSSHIIEFFAIGTAVITHKTDITIETPKFILSLNDNPGAKS